LSPGNTSTLRRGCLRKDCAAVQWVGKASGCARAGPNRVGSCPLVSRVGADLRARSEYRPRRRDWLDRPRPAGVRAPVGSPSGTRPETHRVMCGHLCVALGNPLESEERSGESRKVRVSPSGDCISPEVERLSPRSSPCPASPNPQSGPPTGSRRPNRADGLRGCPWGGMQNAGGPSPRVLFVVAPLGQRRQVVREEPAR
jgi:hypothetical protein